MKKRLEADFIIFDLGNVIIDIYYPETIEFIKTHVDSKLHEKVDGFYLTQFHKEYEKGLISSSKFRDEVRGYFETRWSDSFVDELWNSLLGKIPQERLDLVKKLKESYNVGVLSNTNAIHIEALDQILKTDHGHNSLHEIFDRVFFSHEMNLAKPDPQIYRDMLSSLETEGERVVFFDDLLANVEGARTLGIEAIQVTSPKVIFDYFQHV